MKKIKGFNDLFVLRNTRQMRSHRYGIFVQHRNMAKWRRITGTYQASVQPLRQEVKRREVVNIYDKYLLKDMDKVVEIIIKENRTSFGLMRTFKTEEVSVVFERVLELFNTCKDDEQRHYLKKLLNNVVATSKESYIKYLPFGVKAANHNVHYALREILDDIFTNDKKFLTSFLWSYYNNNLSSFVLKKSNFHLIEPFIFDLFSNNSSKLPILMSSIYDVVTDEELAERNDIKNDNMTTLLRIITRYGADTEKVKITDWFLNNPEEQIKAFRGRQLEELMNFLKDRERHEDYVDFLLQTITQTPNLMLERGVHEDIVYVLDFCNKILEAKTGEPTTKYFDKAISFCENMLDNEGLQLLFTVCVSKASEEAVEDCFERLAIQAVSDFTKDLEHEIDPKDDDVVKDAERDKFRKLIFDQYYKIFYVLVENELCLGSMAQFISENYDLLRVEKRRIGLIISLLKRGSPILEEFFETNFMKFLRQPMNPEFASLDVVEQRRITIDTWQLAHIMDIRENNFIISTRLFEKFQQIILDGYFIYSDNNYHEERLKDVVHNALKAKTLEFIDRKKFLNFVLDENRFEGKMAKVMFYWGRDWPMKLIWAACKPTTCYALEYLKGNEDAAFIKEEDKEFFEQVFKIHEQFKELGFEQGKIDFFPSNGLSPVLFRRAKYLANTHLDWYPMEFLDRLLDAFPDERIRDLDDMTRATVRGLLEFASPGKKEEFFQKFPNFYVRKKTGLMNETGGVSFKRQTKLARVKNYKKGPKPRVKHNTLDMSMLNPITVPYKIIDYGKNRTRRRY